MKVLDSSNYLAAARLDRSDIDDPNKHPFDLPLFQNFTSLEFASPVTFIVGENGSGKSTLLEALAIGMGLNAEGGSRNFDFATRPSHSDLHKALTLVKNIRAPKDSFFLRAESFYNVASNIDSTGAIRSYGGVSLHQQSHGESFMSLVGHRFWGNGLYILDEPEAALSPTRQLQLLRYIHDLVSQQSQFIIATHSPILLAYPDATIYAIKDDAFTQTRYEDTEQYKITRLFLDGYKRVLYELLQG